MKMPPMDGDASVLAQHLVREIVGAPTSHQTDMAALASVVGMLCASTAQEIPDDFMRAALEAYHFALRMRVAKDTRVARA